MIRLIIIVTVLMVSSSMAFQLITDNHFQTGFDVKYDGEYQGSIQYTTNNGSPIWTLGEKNSKSSIYGATPVSLQSGAYKWANIYKAFVMGPTNTDDSDLKLTVNSVSEYGGVYREPGAPWPHFLVVQRISEPDGYIGAASPWLDELTSLDFNIDAKLVFANNIYTNGYDPTLHAAQFLIFFTVQNLNTNSADYGSFLWFGIKLYDDREDLPDLCINPNIDPGTIIYDVGIEPFCTNGLTVGQWKNISGDILPYVKDALDAAWGLDYMTNSINYTDYKIGGMNMGWEVPGLSCVTMQVRDFGLEAYGLYWPKPYEFNTDGEMEGYTYSNMIDLSSPGPTNGTWNFSVPGNDPKFVGPSIRVDADTFRKVKVRMANAGNPIEGSIAQLFWKRNGDTSFAEARSKGVSIGNSGAWAEFTFDMTNDPDWNGEIIQLRLDPIRYGDGHNIGIDYIRFSE